jgi:hypothetical protein
MSTEGRDGLGGTSCHPVSPKTAAASSATQLLTPCPVYAEHYSIQTLFLSSLFSCPCTLTYPFLLCSVNPTVTIPILLGAEFLQKHTLKNSTFYTAL